MVGAPLDAQRVAALYTPLGLGPHALLVKASQDLFPALRTLIVRLQRHRVPVSIEKGAGLIIEKGAGARQFGSGSGLRVGGGLQAC